MLRKANRRGRSEIAAARRASKWSIKQARVDLAGTRVDENWYRYDFGTIPFRLRSDVDLAECWLAELRTEGFQARPTKPSAEKTGSAIAFLRAAVAYYVKLGVTIRRLLTDNGSAFRSKAFVQTCHELGIAKRYTRRYRPQTNGKAERFIQSALREWAYGFTYQRSAQRTAALDYWTHHYNWHRPHQGIGAVAPISRLNPPRDILLTLHI